MFRDRTIKPANIFI